MMAKYSIFTFLFLIVGITIAHCIQNPVWIKIRTFLLLLLFILPLEVPLANWLSKRKNDDNK